MPEDNVAGGRSGNETGPGIECQAVDCTGKPEHLRPRPNVEDTDLIAACGCKPAIRAELEPGKPAWMIPQLRDQRPCCRAPDLHYRLNGVDHRHEPTIGSVVQV